MVSHQRPLLNGRYEINKQLDEGHTSYVYEAFDIETRKNVAIKIIKNAYYFSGVKPKN